MAGECLEADAVGLRAESPPRVEGVVRVADAPGEERLVEGDAVGPVNVAVGVDERGLRVQYEAVEVEYEGADHGALSTATFSLRRCPCKR
jgi:hypothetical protein